MKRNNIYSKIIYFIVSLFLSSSINLKMQIDYKTNSLDFFINKFHFDIFFSIKVISIACIFYFIIQIIFKLLDKIKTKEMIVAYPTKVITAISFIGIFISNLLFLLTYYPASNMYDTLSTITATNKNHTIYSLLINSTYNLFHNISNNMNLSFFLTSIIQIIIMDIIITLIINWYHKTFKNKISTILLLIFFIATPIISNYNSVLIKDSFFAGILLLHIPLLYHLIDSKGEILKNIKYLIYMLLVFILTIFTKNNGIYIIIFISIIIFIKYLKYWKQLGITFLIISMISIPLLSKQKISFQEKINIPIQQISYVITNDNIGLSNEDLKYINKVINLEELRKNYNPYSVNPIKYNKNFNSKYLNNTKNKFIKTWSNILSNHSESYIKSYLLTTYELWSFEKFNPTESRFLGIDKTTYYNQEDFKELENKRIFPKSIQNTLENFYETTTIFFNNGTCFWALIILCLFAIYKDKKELIIISLPLIGVWLTLMIATPTSYAFRYMSPYLYLLPFVLSITIVYCQKNHKE